MNGPDPVYDKDVPAAGDDRPRDVASGGRDGEARRVGIFYDGGWWVGLSGFYRYHHPWRSRLAFAGVRDVVAHWLEQENVVTAGRWVVDVAHFLNLGPVMGHLAVGLRNAGVSVEVIEPMPEVAGTYSWHFGCAVVERTVETGLDAVVLLSNRAVLTMVTERLVRRNVTVVVPGTQISYRDESGRVRNLAVPEPVRRALTAQLPLDDLLERAVRGELPARPVLHESPRQPATRAVAGERPALITRCALMTKWKTSGGCGVAEDDSGQQWFIPWQALPPELEELAPGTRIVLRGSPIREPREPLPRAQEVHLAPEWTHVRCAGRHESSAIRRMLGRLPTDSVGLGVSRVVRASHRYWSLTTALELDWGDVAGCLEQKVSGHV